MKQSVEKQVKQAFDVWDEQKSEIGFDKTALWAAMNEKKAKPVIHFSWYKVASVLIILFLSGALLFSFQSQQALKQSNVQLALELDKTKRVAKPKLEEKIIEKIVYQTQIKEVESASVKKEFAGLLQQYENLQKENLQLKQNALQSEMRYALITDSLKGLEVDWARVENSYIVEIEQLKASSQANGFTVDIDEEALLALAGQKKNKPVKKKRSLRRMKFGFKNSMSDCESGAPLINNIDINKK